MAITTKTLHIALIVETSMESGRQILGGISKYAMENGPWSIFHQPAHLDQSLPEWIDDWRGDGIIARIRSRDTAQAIINTGIPAIDVLGEIEDSGVPLVHVDDRAIATAAFTHLQERSFRHYAFVGIKGPNWSRNRLHTFRSLVADSGSQFGQLSLELNPTITPWEQEQELLSKWLASLAKPCAVMTCNDYAGQRVLDACRRASILVPEELAIVGVDNDEVICTLSTPTLSSVNAGHFEVGYESARSLVELIDGKPIAPQFFVQNYNCVSRESTDATAVNNPTLAAALSFIRNNACQDIVSRDVARHVGVSLSSLKRLFASEHKHPINRCIIRARIDRAKILLRDTDLSVEQIAARIGYSHAHYFSLAFKRETELSPTTYRKQQSRNTR
ncbi:AraC family transcriptional regulator [Mariniblastus fucicola]|uniref:Xylose operon regulatory protein n=1 Tax=Mariniblastus fucicola TaxID=980251 RepID=A0A5B9PQT0_9BACT|nr:DNA-binding transcriptional regulator [Mariniblastus fucicola]QEG24673.1 Xylose operon regulatory protein [Mariniblastus fucicola]